MFVKIQERTEANFLRVSVDGKPLELTQGHGENVLPERWNLRLNVEKRKTAVSSTGQKKKNFTTCVLDTT